MTSRPINVPLLAHSYRRLVLWFGAQLVLDLIAMPLNALPTPTAGVAALSVVVLLGLLALLAALAVYSYRTATALGSSVAVLWAIAMFIPCANVITLLALSASATRACRANGIPVGFFGPKEPSSIVPPVTTPVPPSSIGPS